MKRRRTCTIITWIRRGFEPRCGGRWIPAGFFRAKIQRDGQTICEAEVWRYQKSSLAASLSMALSGVLAQRRRH
ncbi:MAG: hypothetical protein ACLUI3_09390 [Christensenellales bacterium]